MNGSFHWRTKKIIIIYKNINIEHEYELKDRKEQNDESVEGEYKEFLREIKEIFYKK